MIALLSSNLLVRENISKHLSSLPYPLQVFSSSTDWNASISKHTPIIVLLDEDMWSDCNSQDSVNQLKGIQSTCMVIITSKATTSSRIEYLHSGFLDCIQLDIHPLELSLKIKNLLALCPKNNPIMEYPENEQDIILYYLKKNENRHLTVESLAEQLNMSRSSLQRACLRYFCLNPKHLITQSKIQYSIKLIDRGMSNVTSLSNSVGFNNVNNFISSFKRMMGTTPKEYMKRRHAENQSIPTNMPLLVA